ncbi:MAG: CHC2 zinc finger domain-containing protein [Bacteroidales bacterium]
MIEKETVQAILAASKIEEVIGSFHSLNRQGKSLYTACPACGKTGKGKGLIVTPSKGIFKCFSCDFGGKSPVDFLTQQQGMKYPEALEWLANKYCIPVEQTRPRGPQGKKDEKPLTFRDIQLALSGLEEADQKATVRVDGDTVKIVDTFEAGTRDEFGRLTSGDDLIIWYYDLEGKPITYVKPKTSKPLPLFRVRYQNPELHRDKNGRPMKYQSPAGSGSHLFIPEEVRRIYRERRSFKRLYIQEGEKKALKACKHGLTSVGIMGIQNLGYQGKLPYELQLLVQACHVEEVVFVLDADWDHLSNELKASQRVDSRPLSFYYAVKNFRDYFKTFVNLGIYLEIYFAHVITNEKKEKGIDDLLNGTLKLKERELYQDIEQAINEKDGTGKFVQLYKISSVSDLKLLEYWNLHSTEAFAQKYRDELELLPEFIIGRHKWRFTEQGRIEPAQPLQEDEQYWEVQVKRDKSGNEYNSYRFRYLYAYNFLKRRGFGRLMMANRRFEFCQQEHKVIRIVEPYQIKDYVIEFSKEVLAKEVKTEVMDMLYRNAKGYFGPDSLSNIDFMHPVFETADKSYQYLYFKDKYWKITADGIEEKPLSELQNYVWEKQIIPFDAHLVNDHFIEIEQITEELLQRNEHLRQTLDNYIGQFSADFSKEADECHFKDFIWNTGDFYWRSHLDKKTRKPKETGELGYTERFETQLHFVAKMTHIGYLLHEHRDKSCEKAVIAMDGKLSEVGDSNGRSGKSLLGIAIGKMIPQVYIGGKSKELTEDPFLFEEVTEKSKNIFIDDVRANIDFEFFFPVITGRMTINCKGIGKFTLPEKDTPKLYITTNHAINGSTSSFRDRQALIAFSDYYSDDYKPIDDFGINFFEEWDEKQWNLFYNFMAACLQLYFKVQRNGWGDGKSGLISPPTERLERRRMRQYIGEVFISWADEYYGVSDDEPATSDSPSPIGDRIPRRELYNDFLDRNPTQRKFFTSNVFFKKIVAWAKFRGLMVNPKHGPNSEGRPNHDKTGGVEFLTIQY